MSHEAHSVIFHGVAPKTKPNIRHHAVASPDAPAAPQAGSKCRRRVKFHPYCLTKKLGQEPKGALRNQAPCRRDSNSSDVGGLGWCWRPPIFAPGAHRWKLDVFVPQLHWTIAQAKSIAIWPCRFSDHLKWGPTSIWMWTSCRLWLCRSFESWEIFGKIDEPTTYLCSFWLQIVIRTDVQLC